MSDEISITPERLRQHADNISPINHVYPSDILGAAASEIERLRLLFRINAIRWNPNITHEEIDRILDGKGEK